MLHQPDELLAQAEASRRAGRIDEAVGLADRALEGATARGDELAMAFAKLELGNLLRYQPQTVRAIQLILEAEGVFRARRHPKLARSLVLRGMAMGDAGDHSAALELYGEALHLLEDPEQPRDLLQEGTCQGAIGLACTQLEEFDRAEEAYLTAIRLYDEAGSGDTNAFVYNNLAILRVRSIQALADRLDPRAADLGEQMERFIQAGLAINSGPRGSPLANALLLNTHGDGLRALGRTAEALPILESALAAYHAMANPRGEIDATTDLAAALLELGRLDDALARLTDARARVQGLDLRDHERRIEELLAEVHERRGDPAAALAHYKAFHRLHRELQDRDTQKRLQALALRAEIDRALRESREDALTGVANRRRFEEVARSRPRVPETFAVAALDIDHFKRINDQHSHAAGDAVLREVGSLLRAHCRGSDFVARIGGEEFMLLLAGVTAAEARESCERLRATIERHDWGSVVRGVAVTVSIGVAAGDGRASLTDLLQAADVQLYEAKRGGRNRVRVRV